MMNDAVNPYRTIWLNPRSTFENCILNNNDQRLIATPIIIFGFCIGLDSLVGFSKIIDENIWLSFAFAIPLCIGLTFLVFGLIMPWLIKFFGRIWDGAASMRQLVNVISISSIPLSLILVHQLALLAMGQEPTFENVNQGLTYIFQLWSFSLLIIGVSQVQKFTYGMALLNILLSYLPIIIVGLLKG